MELPKIDEETSLGRFIRPVWTMTDKELFDFIEYTNKQEVKAKRRKVVDQK